MLVNHVHAAFVVCQTLPFAALNETRVLPYVSWSASRKQTAGVLLNLQYAPPYPSGLPPRDHDTPRYARLTDVQMESSSGIPDSDACESYCSVLRIRRSL